MTCTHVGADRLTAANGPGYNWGDGDHTLGGALTIRNSLTVMRGSANHPEPRVVLYRRYGKACRVDHEEQLPVVALNPSYSTKMAGATVFGSHKPIVVT